MSTVSLLGSLRGEASTRGELPMCSRESIRARVYQLASVVFSVAGNWPFYGVAKQFGSRYSEAFGKLLGLAEFISYVFFRILNFADIWDTLFPSSEGGYDKKTVVLSIVACFFGLAAQIPLMVLVYYGNDENLIYPILSGGCESAFTILSLILAVKHYRTSGREAQEHRERLEGAMTRLLEELPGKFREGEELVFDEMEMRRALVPVEPVVRPRWDVRLQNVAKGVGAGVALYLTVVNGTVTYVGIVRLKEDAQVLAGCATAFVSLANLYLLLKFCVEESAGVYAGVRDLVKGRYAWPLAHAVAPEAWGVGRVAAVAFASLSFGTTAEGAVGYVPSIGEALIYPAPLSSFLLLHGNLCRVFDGAVLQGAWRCGCRCRRAIAVDGEMRAFLEKIRKAPDSQIRAFVEELEGESSLVYEEVLSQEADEKGLPMASETLPTLS